mmetsp:Transcript_19094/g.26872  ORF Transcript_19094/g.26872 Transcript_19094/m.26872 type:complete len:416 (+) Transcript_19094:923-2170(+)
MHLYFLSSLATLGAKVTQVTTDRFLSPRKVGKASSVSIIQPAVGKLKLGFSYAIGRFDALVDTLTDEAKVGETMLQSYQKSYGSDDASGNPEHNPDFDWDVFENSSAVLRELKNRNKCSRYVSTLSTSQRILRDEGLVFGRQRANNHIDELIKDFKTVSHNKLSSKLSGKKNREYQYVIPPAKFGPETLQTLLDNKVVYPSRQQKNAEVLTRQWSLKDYWELTTWPRDSSGAANIRFGFPVIDDIDTIMDEQDTVVSESTAENSPILSEISVADDDDDDVVKPKTSYVKRIDGLDYLEQEILSKDKDCLLFLSAKYCRTCKYLAPQYTKLARDKKEEDLVFAQADLSGKVGKTIGKTLGVNAVPSFMMFRKGKAYGDVISVSRLPSKKLNLALKYLTSGEKWDSRKFRTEVEGKK